MPHELSPCRDGLFRRQKSPRRCLSPASKAGKRELARIKRSLSRSRSPLRPLKDCRSPLFRRELKPRRCLSPKSRSGKEEMFRQSQQLRSMSRERSPVQGALLANIRDRRVNFADPKAVVVVGPKAVVAVAPKSFEAHKLKRSASNVYLLSAVWSVDNPVIADEFEKIQKMDLDMIAYVINSRRAIKNMAEVKQYLADDFGVYLTFQAEQDLIKLLRIRDSAFYARW